MLNISFRETLVSRKCKLKPAVLSVLHLASCQGFKCQALSNWYLDIVMMILAIMINMMMMKIMMMIKMTMKVTLLDKLSCGRMATDSR